MLRRLFDRKSGSAQPAKEAPTPPAFEPLGTSLQPRPFDIVQEAEHAASVGNDRRAEQLFLKAIEIDRGEQFPGFPAGRYGAFLESRGRADDAIRVYEQAIRAGTDIPAVFGPLMTIYAARGEEENLFRTANAYSDLPRVENSRVVEMLTRLAVERAKAGDPGAAERWLSRTEGVASRDGSALERFSAWGQRCLVIERSGDSSRALDCGERAIAAGSTDRTTYTRVLMAYEKHKRWADARQLIQVALGVQRDAAWEEDLRKRLARVNAKAGDKTSASTVKTKAEPPVFSVRKGHDQIALIDQVSFKPAPRVLLFANDSILVSGGTSTGNNLALANAHTFAPAWAVNVPGASAKTLSLANGGYFAATDYGRIGNGGANLTWLDRSGSVTHTELLPDKLSEVRRAGNLIVAGCRDGFLYAFDERGYKAWQFATPDTTAFGDQPSSRACPYFIQTSHDGKRIVLSSWNRTYQLDAKGKLKWSWQTNPRTRSFDFSVPYTSRVDVARCYQILGLPTSASQNDVGRAFRARAKATHPDLYPGDPGKTGEFREVLQAYERLLGAAAEERAHISVEIALSPATVYGLASNQTGNRTLVASSDGSLSLLDDRGDVISRRVASEGPGILAADVDLNRIVFAHWNGLNFYQDAAGLVALYPLDYLCNLRLSPDGSHVIAWHGKQLHVLGMNGSLVAEIEFARDIADAAFTNAREFLVASGKLVKMRINGR
ncbi:MAG: DnaJ domain-containing protein [Thermomicrobiales bacterium]